MKKYFAEFIGTATLVLFGCGAAVLAGDQVGQLGIAFAFGLSIVAMAYAIGPISGCHINPAVTIGALVSNRISIKDAIPYIIAQCLGAIAGASILYLIASGSPDFTLANGLGHNGYGAGYQGQYNLLAAALFETVATFIFVFVILGSTHEQALNKFAGLAIGFTLVLIHIVGIHVTGVSVNPARSLGPALFNGHALSQLWVFIVFPILGAVIAGLVYKLKLIYNK
ncbi:aquaporin Z [Entomomonas sp. E2T0]|uniref:aquaporin Z n=1 Tax=Entomomonas sp. E2T0 TaxID=2930213 RepID=UPI0022282AC9|nr:aquaporin Z [Entomomonas sp. E2T0]UYZ83908.1 aquaporin Z [Entomomonas sp. E2T0]